MLCEKPVVATAVGGVPEEVAGCGFAVEPRNPQEMAQAILTLMNDPELSMQLGRTAREKAVQEYSVRQSASAHEASYRQLKELYPSRQLPSPAVEPGPQTLTGRFRRSAAELTGSVVAVARTRAFALTTSVGNRGSTSRPAPVVLRLLPANGSGPSHIGHSPQGGADLPAVQNDRLVSSNGHGTNGNGNGNNGYAGGTAPAPGSDVVEPGPASADRPGRGARKRIRGVSVPSQFNWRVTNGRELALLAEEIDRRDPLPINSLEVTALLESLGTTDAVALQRYGAADAFELGDEILSRIRRAHPPAASLEHPAPLPVVPPARTKEAWLDYARGPLALMIAACLMITIAVYGSLGRWDQTRILALSAGLSGSMLLTSGFIMAASRRTSVYMGLGKPQAAGLFFGRTMIVAGVCVVLAALAVVAASYRLSALTPADRLTFASAFIGLSALWLAGGGLSLVGKPGWLGLGIAAGLIVGVMVDGIAARFTAAHLVAATLAGFGVALTVEVIPLYRSFSTKGVSKPARVVLPPTTYLIWEAAPYFAYSLLYMVFILSPHVLGWLGMLGAGQERMWAVTSVEIGLTLALLPIVLVGGMPERALREFWRFAPVAQAYTPGTEVRRFRRYLDNFYRNHWAFHTLVITVLTLAAFSAFCAALGLGLLQAWLRIPNPDQMVLFFSIGLLIYWLLCWGAFNCTACITLGCPSLAIGSVVVSIVVTIIVGTPLSLVFSFSYAASAFLCGAITFVLVSQWAVGRLVKRADYHYVSSI
jgi:hypothetical protein